MSYTGFGLTPVAITLAPTVSTPSGIPYRTDVAVPEGSVIWAFVVTVVVLAVLIGFAVYARRRGWMTGSGTELLSGPRVGIDVLATRRISLGTTVHVLRYDGVDYLLVESSQGMRAAVSTLQRRVASGENKS